MSHIVYQLAPPWGKLIRTAGQVETTPFAINTHNNDYSKSINHKRTIHL